jgi:probable phosphoglycerate mutase
MRVLLIRHGTSTWSAEQRWQGWADPPLSADSVGQAERVAAGLRGLDIRIVVSSDLARARSTAEIIARVAGTQVSIEPALRERNIGLWTGLTAAEVESRWPGQQDAYRSNPEIRFPDGEQAEALVRRAIPVLLTIAQRGPDDGVAVVVSHGGLIRCVRLALGREDRPVPEFEGCWLEARDRGLRLVADADAGRVHVGPGSLEGTEREKAGA